MTLTTHRHHMTHDTSSHDTHNTSSSHDTYMTHRHYMTYMTCFTLFVQFSFKIASFLSPHLLPYPIRCLSPISTRNCLSVWCTSCVLRTGSILDLTFGLSSVWRYATWSCDVIKYVYCTNDDLNMWTLCSGLWVPSSNCTLQAVM